jgi:hypothetical protein
MIESFNALLARQDGLLTRRQALQYLSEIEIDAKLGRSWRVILPGVYATFTGPLTDQHRARAALLHAGDGSMLSDLDALQRHRVPNLPADPFTRVLVAAEVQRSSREFVIIRRTTRRPRALTVDGLAVAPAHRALCEFVLRHEDERECLAVASSVLQVHRATIDQLVDDAKRGPARGRTRLCRVIEALAAGVRSAPEGDFRRLVLTSKIVPEPKWNWLIQLPSGRKISPDGMIMEAALIHETNGRRYHSPELAGEDVFEDMQRRHDEAVAAGFTVLHNPPRRIDAEGAAVLREFETCYLRDNGRGLPPGVVILRAGPPGTTSNVALPIDIAG